MMEEGLIEEALFMAQALTEAEKHRSPEAEDVSGTRVREAAGQQDRVG